MSFEIVHNPDLFYSEANQAYIMKSINELQAGKGTVHELIEINDDKKNNRN